MLRGCGGGCSVAWPTLQELHRKLFNQTFEGAQRAAAALLPGVEVKTRVLEVRERARRSRFNRLRGFF